MNTLTTLKEQNIYNSKEAMLHLLHNAIICVKCFQYFHTMHVLFIIIHTLILYEPSSFTIFFKINLINKLINYKQVKEDEQKEASKKLQPGKKRDVNQEPVEKLNIEFNKRRKIDVKDSKPETEKNESIVNEDPPPKDVELKKMSKQKVTLKRAKPSYDLSKKIDDDIGESGEKQMRKDKDSENKMIGIYRNFVSTVRERKHSLEDTNVASGQLREMSPTSSNTSQTIAINPELNLKIVEKLVEERSNVQKIEEEKDPPVGQSKSKFNLKQLSKASRRDDAERLRKTL